MGGNVSIYLTMYLSFLSVCPPQPFCESFVSVYIYAVPRLVMGRIFKASLLDRQKVGTAATAIRRESSQHLSVWPTDLAEYDG